MNVVALLDRPSSRSFGMVPFVVLDPAGSLHIYGLQGYPDKRTSSYELETLVQDRHAYAVTASQDTQLPQNAAAGWLGDIFAAEVDGVPAGIPTAQLHRVEGAGRFWIASRHDVQQVLDRWLEATAKVAFSSRGTREAHRLARTMLWVAPDSSLTRAAVWATGTEKSKQASIAWWTRLGCVTGLQTAEDALARRLDSIVQNFGATAPVYRTAVSPAGEMVFRHACWCGESFFSVDPIQHYRCFCGIAWHQVDGHWRENLRSENNY